MKKKLLALYLIPLIIIACSNIEGHSEIERISMNVKSENLEKATFAGGCFWCMEHPFEKVDGVVSVVSGYTGGHKSNPKYEEVSSGSTGHYEAVQVSYDPEKVTYSELLDIYWKQFDPTDAGGSFVDRGQQYASAVFYHNESQKAIAEKSKDDLDKSGVFAKPIVTEILAMDVFYNAEDYHQDYYSKNPIRYKFYRSGSGRDSFLEKVWSGREKKVGSSKKPSDDKLKKRLTPLQYKVTQEDGTEQAFNNEYWDNKEEGIYVDIVSGESLFSSTDKYDSGTGWPSFTRPIETNNIVEKKDRSLFTVRTEVRSMEGDSHLGHLFNDGPRPTGLRYCINSSALRFIPKKELEKKGFEKYLELFD